jgi:hypothetical protein
MSVYQKQIINMSQLKKAIYLFLARPQMMEVLKPYAKAKVDVR